MNIGDVFLALHAVGDQFEKEAITQAEAAGDKAGKTLGERLGSAAGKAVRVGAAVVSAGLAIATKGMLELEDATADFRKETGATEEEATAAGKAILSMSTRNLQPIKEIGRALSAVHTEMGLTGKEAEDLTEDFLKLARVTGRDAADEVKAFDNILDAWGLTADDARVIMDKLVLSHQKYGGSIAENEAALSAMAPQLKALNLSVDDGIGLLNLFASSGLDAAAGQKALNTAITNLPKGESLSDFLARLSQVTDDGERAQLAMQVFGAKAGASLANAIKPGISSIDQFKVSTQDATGATEEAAAALNDTFGTRFQLLLRGFSAKLIEAGQAFGPLLTGAGSVATLLGSIFGPGAIKKLVAAAGSAGKQAGEALIDAAGTATGAAGTIFGNVIAQPIIDALDPEKNSLLGRGARAASAKLGALWGAVFGAAARVAEGVTTAVLKLPGVQALTTAVQDTGTALGSRFGAAFTVGFLLAIPALAVEFLRWIQDRSGLNDQVPTEWGGKAGSAFAGGFVEGVRVEMSAGDQLAGTIRDDWAGDVGGAATELGASLYKPIKGDDTHGADGAKKSVRDAMSDILQSIADTRSTMKAQAEGLINEVFDPIIAQADLAAAQQALDDSQTVISAGGTKDTLSKIAEDRKAISDARTTKERDDAKAQLATDLETAAAEVANAQATTPQLQAELLKRQIDVATFGDGTAKIAAIKALLANSNIVSAYENGTPDQKRAIEAWRTELGLTMGQIATDAVGFGWQVGDNYTKSLDSKAPDVSGATDVMVGGVLVKLPHLATLATGWGWQLGENYATGLKSSYGDLTDAATGAARILSDNIRIASPAKEGPLSLAGGPEAWGARLARVWARGIASGVRLVEQAAGAIAGAADLPGMASIGSPEVRMTGLARAQQMASAQASFGLATAAATPAGGAVNISIPVQGIMPIERPEDIIRPLQQLASTGWLGGPKRILYGVEPVRG